MSHSAIALGISLLGGTPVPTPAAVEPQVADVTSAAASNRTGAVTGVGQLPVRLSFTDTTVPSVFRALAARLGVNIVYAGKDRTPITLTIIANSADEAVRAAVSAAGLTFRRTQNTFVVAGLDEMKRALEPFSFRARFQVDPAKATEIAKALETAFPQASVTAIGDKIVFYGIQEDLKEAKQYIDDFSGEAQTPTLRAVEVYSVRGDVNRIVAQMSTLFPDVIATANGSIVTLTGGTERVTAAKAAIEKLDKAVDSMDSGVVTEVYEAKYITSGPLQRFLKESMKDVDVFVAPKAYSPERGLFSPISSRIQQQDQGGGGGQQQQQATPGVGGGQQGSGQDLQQLQLASTEQGRRLVVRGPKARVTEAIRLLEAIDVRPPQVMVDVNVVETTPNFSSNIGNTFNWQPLQFLEVPSGTPADLTTFNNLNTTKPAGLGQISRMPGSLTATLSAQITQGNAKILANPRVQVMDNDSASVFIGDTLRVRIATAGALGAQTIEVLEFPVGIILLLRPRINPDGTITMHVNPAVSTIRSIDANGLPQTSTREAETTVVVNDGETVVLGGLIRDEQTETLTKFPILGDLPVIGELFKNRTKSKRRTDIVVTITPRILNDSKPGTPK
ncbi:PulD Type II secretory pathway, component PulD [Fimbriimonadaceae bacterium]